MKIKRYVLHVLCCLFGIFLVGMFFGCSAGNEDSTNTANDRAKTYSWKMVTTWPKNLPALGFAPERFASMVDTMSDGRLNIKVYAAGELVGAMEVFDSVSSGAAEMGHGAAYYWTGKAPAAALFTTVPFGMNAQEMNAWLSYGGGLELWRELYEPFDLIPFVCGNSGVQMAGWFNVEINSLEDLKGLKMRIPGLGAEVMKRAGAAPQLLPAVEIFTSLQTGVIDATEWVGPYNDLTLGLYQIAKYYYYPGWHEPNAAIELIINKSAFEQLPTDLQKIVEVAATAINQDMLNEFTARNNAALQTLLTEHGVELRQLPDEVVNRLREISAEVLDEVAAYDSLSQRIVESYTQFHQEVRQWSAISEEAYFNARE